MTAQAESLTAAGAGLDALAPLLTSEIHLVPDFITNATPQNGVPSLTEPPQKRRGRPSGEMAMV